MEIIHPLSVQNKLYPIQVVLNDLASQNNCDGYPYDQMIMAAKYIEDLEIQQKNLEERVTEFERQIRFIKTLIEKEETELSYDILDILNPLYCPNCGACGIEGCCSPDKCKKLPCLYGEDYLTSYKELIAENNSLRKKLSKLEAFWEYSRLADREQFEKYERNKKENSKNNLSCNQIPFEVPECPEFKTKKIDPIVAMKPMGENNENY